MELQKLLERLDGNYSKRKSAIKQLHYHFTPQSSNRFKVLNKILQRKIFLMPEFWPRAQEILDAEGPFEETIQSWLVGGSVFFKYRRELEQKLIKDQENKLFESFNSNLSATDLFLAFSKAAEIGSTNWHPAFNAVKLKDDRNVFQTRLLRPYDFGSLQCLNRLIKRNSKAGKSENHVGNTNEFSYEQLIMLDRLLLAEKELDLLDGMIDDWLLGGLHMVIEGPIKQPGKILLKPSSDKQQKRFRRHLAKNFYRRTHYEQRASEVVSEDPHFKETDQKFKTDEGLITIVSSNISTTGKSNGTVVIEEPSLFEGTMEEVNDKIALFTLQTNLHYKYRRYRERSTFPADVEELKATMITDDRGQRISLQTIFKVVDVISALSDNFKTFESSQVLNFKLNLVDQNVKQKGIKELSVGHLEAFDEFLAEKSQMKLSRYNCALDIKSLIWLIRKLTRLRNAQIFRVLRLLQVSKSNSFDFQSIVFKGRQAYWKWQPFTERSISTHLYEKYFLERVYKVYESHKARARKYDERLAKYFSKAGYKALPNLEYGTNKGEIDVLAIRGNVIFLIQIKLSNKHRDNHQKQYTWGSRNINKAIEQSKRGVDFFSSHEGRELIKEKLPEVKFGRKPMKVVPLIVADQFYYDHEQYCYDKDGGKQVRVVSFFELYLILENLPLLNVNHRPEYSYRPMPYLGPVPIKPITIEPDEHGNTSFSIDCFGRVKTNDLSDAPKQLPREEIDQRKFRRWWDSPKGISPKHLIELIESNAVWEFLDDELGDVSDQRRLACFRAVVGYDV